MAHCTRYCVVRGSSSVGCRSSLELFAHSWNGKVNKMVETDDSSLDKNERRSFIGIVFLLLYLGIAAMSFNFLLVSSPEQLQISKMAIEMLEKDNGVLFTPAQRNLLLREIKMTNIVSSLLYLISFLPLLFLGLYYIQGPNHKFWSWQKNRISRHPIIASIFFFFGISGGLRLFITRILNPIQSTDSMSNSNLDLNFAPILALIFLSISLWLYLGRNKEGINSQLS
jgi:amino acid permease